MTMNDLTDATGSQLRRLRATSLEHVIVFDTETTGLDDHDEILSIAICDGTGRILLDPLIRPTRHRQWPQAQAIHHIGPDQVAGQPTAQDIRTTILDTFRHADLIAGYNGAYDLRLLRQSGIPIDDATDGKDRYDCMKAFAPIYGQWDPKHQDYQWQKLSTAAAYYGYTFHAHDAAEDVKATAHVYRHLIGLDL